MATPSTSATYRNIENLALGGGYTGSTSGVTGLSIDGDGNIATDADLTVLGTATFTGGIANTSSGDWTITATGVENVESIGVKGGHYIRVGNVVTFSGYIVIDVTADATITEVRLSLPVASSFTTSTDASGTCCAFDAAVPGTVLADATNDELLINFVSSGTGQRVYRFTGGYEVI